MFLTSGHVPVVRVLVKSDLIHTFGSDFSRKSLTLLSFGRHLLTILGWTSLATRSLERELTVLCSQKPCSHACRKIPPPPPPPPLAWVSPNTELPGCRRVVLVEPLPTLAKNFKIEEQTCSWKTVIGASCPPALQTYMCQCYFWQSRGVVQNKSSYICAYVEPEGAFPGRFCFGQFWVWL